MEVNSGDQAQIDFGTATVVIGLDGMKRRPWMFRIVLSQSRKAYSEVVWRQTTDNFIAAIENAFHDFVGVPKTLVIVDSGSIPRECRSDTDHRSQLQTTRPSVR